jgi:geranylgeranyl reductase family protein
MTAYHLAQAGLRCVILEAKRFPRAKACGGGIQVRATPYLPPDLSTVVRGTMRQVSLTFGLHGVHTRTYPEPLVLTVLRKEFDQFLLRSAETAGAKVMEGVRVQSFAVSADGSVIVQTESGDFSADCLIGADGANSIVSRLMNSRANYFWQTAVYCEVPYDLLKASSINVESMHIDWGTLPSGYAWAFPKDGYLNIGAGGPIATARGLRGYAARFAADSGLVPHHVASELTFTGHQLPTLTKETKIARGNVILVGDAAGLVEPFTGDGISFACQSALIAARYVCSALGSGNREPREYSDRIMAAMGNELLDCRRLLSLSAAFPRRVYELFKYNEFVWQVFCKVLRGEESFFRLKKEILGPLSFAAKLIDVLSPTWERKALSSDTLWDSIRG